MPYLSLGTVSEKICQAYLKLLKEKFGIIKNLHRNKRDNCYNIVLKNEDAILVATYLYEDAPIYLNRKYEKYLEIKKWIRTVKKVTRKDWTDEELDYITTHSIQESIEKLHRTESSIKTKLFRLKTNNK